MVAHSQNCVAVRDAANNRTKLEWPQTVDKRLHSEGGAQRHAVDNNRMPWFTKLVTGHPFFA